MRKLKLLALLAGASAIVGGLLLSPADAKLEPGSVDLTTQQERHIHHVNSPPDGGGGNIGTGSNPGNDMGFGGEGASATAAGGGYGGGSGSGSGSGC